VFYRFGRRRRAWNGGGEFGNLAQSPNRRRRVSNGGADLSSVAQSLECRRRISVTVLIVIFLSNPEIGQYKEFLATDEYGLPSPRLNYVMLVRQKKCIGWNC